MIYENKSFNTWEDVIMCFFENKVENIQNTDPKIPCQIFKAREYIETKDKEINVHTFDPCANSYNYTHALAQVTKQ